MFSPIDGGCEGFLERDGLNSLELHSAIDKQKALELASAAQEKLLFEKILKKYDELQTTHDFVISLGYAPKFFLNALLDLNTTLAKHLNAPVVAVAQTSLEYLKAMHSHILKKEAPFAVGLFAGEMLEKPNFLSASLCKGELEADLIESVLQTKSEITTPLAFQMSLEKKAKKQIKKVVLPESEDERILMIRENLTKMGIIKDFNQIDAIGHRVVQGGDKFHAPVLVNELVMQEIGKLSVLAPLAQPGEFSRY